MYYSGPVPTSLFSVLASFKRTSLACGTSLPGCRKARDEGQSPAKVLSPGLSDSLLFLARAPLLNGRIPPLTHPPGTAVNQAGFACPLLHVFLDSCQDPNHMRHEPVDPVACSHGRTGGLSPLKELLKGKPGDIGHSTRLTQFHYWLNLHRGSSYQAGSGTDIRTSIRKADIILIC